ncbi:MAG: hypothetical protein NC432_06595 [Roseburia sp.]|nr:hypothetical protein [Roseburia sp.]MCM1097742.1 hypothetical protein [Ruminococcus flavefaciens]MCM1218101.1 hypothetical protein [Lachnospiraceae bacterium]
MAELRIGKVSNIDYDNGMIRVVYTDRDGSVTKPLPVLTFNDEYKMPKVGQYVLVGHLSNGTEAAYAMGTFWNAANDPGRSGKGVYRKEYATKQGEAYTDYDEEEKKLELHGDNLSLTGSDIDAVGDTVGIEAAGAATLKGDTITFTCSAGTITLAEIIRKLG